MTKLRKYSYFNEKLIGLLMSINGDTVWTQTWVSYVSQILRLLLHTDRLEAES